MRKHDTDGRYMSGGKKRGLDVQQEIETLGIYLAGHAFTVQEAYNAIQSRAIHRTSKTKLTTSRVVQVLGDMVSDGKAGVTMRSGVNWYRSNSKARALVVHAWVDHCQEGNWISIGSNRAAA